MKKLIRMPVLIFLLLLATVAGAYAQSSTPVLFYTNITSGPKAGGENNNGIYISLFGKGFGSDISKVQVFINNVEVAAYRYLGPSLGRSDVQQLTIQPGAAVSTGNIKLVVNGATAVNQPLFTVRTGDIFFVSRYGNDTTGQIGNVDKPFRHVQTTFDRTDFNPGDFIVMRGGTWTDIGRNDAFLTVYNKTGTLGTPLAITAYPGERPYIDAQGSRGGFYFSQTNGGVVISGMTVDGNGADLIPLGIKNNNLRIVNNDLFGLWQNGNGAAAISGNGKNWKILGNSIHDNGYNKLYHAIYIDNDQAGGDDNIELGYNRIYNQTGGRGILVFWWARPMTNITIHDNLIHDTDSDGILLGQYTGAGFLVYNNVIYRTGIVDGSALRIDSDFIEAKVYNNTIYNASVAKTEGAVYFQNAKSIDFSNNIVYAINGQCYLSNLANLSVITSSNNLWFGGGAAPSLDVNPVNANPAFVNLASLDFHLSASSPAIDAGRDLLSSVPTDYDGVPRQSGAFDIGAFEYVP